MFTEAYLEPSRTSTLELFFTSVKPYFINVLNLIELPLGSIFYTTHLFVKKHTTVKASGEKVLRTIFFRNSKLCNGMASSHTQNMNREGFLI